MIRAFKPEDMDEVLHIWLQASIRAHSFVGKEFWESRVDDMRDKYIPASDTYVFTEKMDLYPSGKELTNILGILRS